MIEEYWLKPMLDGIKGFERAVDIGANVGDWSALLASKFAVVDAFEPDPRLHAGLMKRFQSSRRVFPHFNAVAADEAPARFRMRSGAAQSSLLPDHPFGHGEVVDTVPVFCLTLPQAVRGGADFVKIDIEGSERFLEYPDNVGAYLIECHRCFDEVLSRIPLSYEVHMVMHPIAAAAAQGHCWLFAENERYWQRTWVSEAEEAYIRKVYGDQSMLNDEIASDLDMNEAEFHEACEAIGLQRRENPPIYVPSLQEIRTACAEVRVNWSTVDREERLRSAWGDGDTLQ